MDLPKPEEVQQGIDDWLKAHPEYAKHVEYVRYVKQGDTPPADATHGVKLFEIANPSNDALIVAKVKFFARHWLNGLLKDY